MEWFLQAGHGDMQNIEFRLIVFLVVVAIIGGCRRDETAPDLPRPTKLAIPDGGWAIFVDQPERLFEEARQAYFAGDVDCAAATIQRSTKVLTIWAHRADDQWVRSTLYIANSKLRSLTANMKHHQVPLDDFDEAFVFAHYAIARAHESNARALAATEPDQAGQALVESVSHIQFGQHWSGLKDTVRDADRMDRVMAIAISLLSGDTVDPSIVAATLDDLDQELELLKSESRHAKESEVDVEALDEPPLDLTGSPMLDFSDEPDYSFHEAMRFIRDGRPHGVVAELRMAAAWIDLMAARAQPPAKDKLFEIVRMLEKAAGSMDTLDLYALQRLFAWVHAKVAVAALDIADATLEAHDAAAARDMTLLAARHIWNAEQWCQCLDSPSDQQLVWSALDRSTIEPEDLEGRLDKWSALARELHEVSMSLAGELSSNQLRSEDAVSD